VAGSLVIAACGSGSSSSGGSSSGSSSNSNSASSYGTVLFGSLPSAGTPAKGGTITMGLLTGSTPTMIFPMADCTHTTAYNSNFQSAMYAPLYFGPDGARPEVDYNSSIASGPPIEAEGGKEYTIKLKPGWKWSNGQPVTANDVLFNIDLMKAALKESASNSCQYVPGQFPMSVTSATAPNATTVVLKLNKAYNPGYFLENQLQDTNYGVYPMPSTAWNIDSAGGPHLNYAVPANALKIYNYLFKQGTTPSTFDTSPLWKIVDGPFKLKDFNVTNGSYDQLANPSYGGAVKPQYSELSAVAYTSWTAEENAAKAGSLDVAPQAQSDVIPQLATLKSDGLSVFGGPSWGYDATYINFNDTTNHFGSIMKQPYAVQALYHLEDQPAIITGILKGAGVPQYGPVPSSPQSPDTPTDSVTPLYPYSPTTAVALLKAHGWKVVPNGQSTCIKPGTGAGECGAGIPAGTPFGGVWLNTPASVTPDAVLSSETLTSAAKQYAGIDFTLKSVSFNEAQNYNDAIPQGKSLTNSWAMNNTASFDFDFYPTMEGVFNTGAPFNEGDYDDATANSLMNTSVFSSNPKAVISEASYLAKSPPVLFFPGADQLSLVSDKMGSPSNGLLALDYVVTEPQYWYLKK
jgi:peptide/nickel transport system substrate-binding protein